MAHSRSNPRKLSVIRAATPPPAAPESSGRRKSPEPGQLLEAYRTMLRARLNDEKTIVLYKQNKCHFQIGVAGHEAVQVAAGQIFRPGKDWFYPYYRDMALCAALGMTDEEFMLNALNKRDDPNSHGRQMPMHWGDKSKRIVNQSSPTGTQFLQATGSALAIKRKRLDEVVYVSAGEGTCSQGDFHEALNWSARERLPVVFVIQNNGFAISVPLSEQIAGGSVSRIASGYEGMATAEVDGTDFFESLSAASAAHERALSGQGPTVIEAHVVRLQSHSISDNHLKYRTADEIDQEKTKDPLLRLRRYLLSRHISAEEELSTLERQVKREIDDAAERAEKRRDWLPQEALEFTWSNPRPWEGIEEREARGPEIYLVDAINHALDEELSRNPDACVFGQDVAGGKGGVFTVTNALTARHGPDRVFNSPLAESSIIGVAIGMATNGLLPIAEIQFGDYVWTGMMQIRNELAMMCYRSAGDFPLPVVIRIPVGGYIHGGSYHSQNIEATFAHFPGLYVVYPSNATDAKGLLKAAFRGSDPVLFLEHKGLYRQPHARGPEGDADFLVPLGRAKVVREGHHATIVSWGALVHKALLAARALEKEGVSIEVIDIRSIVPLDMEAIEASVRKTGRILIAHEDVTFMGFGAEIAARIADSCFPSLDAPVKRVGMKYCAAVPHAPVLEDAVLPQNETVVSALRELLSF